MPTPWLNDSQMLVYSVSKYRVSCAVAPEPSDCTTGVIGSDGSACPLLSFVIAGSSQFVIWLVKIFVSVSPDRRRLRTCVPCTLIWYGNAVPPAAIGRYAYGRPCEVSSTPVTGSRPW